MPFNEDTMALKSLSTVRLVSYSVSMSQEASKKDKRLITICYQLGAILISPSGTSESSFSFTIRTFSLLEICSQDKSRYSHGLQRVLWVKSMNTGSRRNHEVASRFKCSCRRIIATVNSIKWWYILPVLQWYTYKMGYIKIDAIGIPILT